MSDFDDTLI